MTLREASRSTPAIREHGCLLEEINLCEWNARWMTKPVRINGADLGFYRARRCEVFWPIQFHVDPFRITHIGAHVAGAVRNWAKPASRSYQFHALIAKHSDAENQRVPDLKPLSVLLSYSSHFVERYPDPVSTCLDPEGPHIAFRNVSLPLSRAKGGELSNGASDIGESRHQNCRSGFSAEQLSSAKVGRLDDGQLSPNFRKLRANEFLDEWPCSRFLSSSIGHKADIRFGEFSASDQNRNGSALGASAATPNLDIFSRDHMGSISVCMN